MTVELHDLTSQLKRSASAVLVVVVAAGALAIYALDGFRWAHGALAIYEADTMWCLRYEDLTVRARDSSVETDGLPPRR